MAQSNYREIEEALRGQRSFRGNSCDGQTDYNGVYRVWSYSTLILAVGYGEVLYYDSRKYSRTTSRLQNIIERTFDTDSARCRDGEGGYGG